MNLGSPFIDVSEGAAKARSDDTRAALEVQLKELVRIHAHSLIEARKLREEMTLVRKEWVEGTTAISNRLDEILRITKQGPLDRLKAWWRSK